MQSLHTVLVGTLIVTAGCTTATPSGGSPTISPTPTTSETPTLTEPSVHPGLTANLEVSNYALAPVHLTITELGQYGRGIVLNKTYTDQSNIEFGDKGRVFRENGSYRVVIRVNGTVRWNETIQHYESYQLQVDSNGSVTVQSHSQA